MVAALSVYGSAHWIADKSSLEGSRLDLGCYLARRSEGFLGFAISDQLDSLEKTAAPNIADIGVLTKLRAQSFH